MQIAKLFASGLQRIWSLRFWAFHFILLTALWFVFEGQLSISETWVGLGAAALGIIGAVLAHGTSTINFRPSPRWVVELWRLPGSILRDNWILTGVLFQLVVSKKRKYGSMQLVRFRAGGENATDAARRALAIVTQGVSPNSVVIGIDNQKNFMLVHKIVPRKEPEYMKNLGAE